MNYFFIYFISKLQQQSFCAYIQMTDMLNEALKTNQLTSIQSLVADDLAQINRLLKSRLPNKDTSPLINTIGQYILSNTGKQLRPITTILAAKACQALTNSNHANNTSSAQNTRYLTLAAAIELIHNATLLHDDVVDEASLRRHMPTANTKWNNAKAVLVGDFLYAQAFECMVEIGEIEVMSELASATRDMAIGEASQMTYQHNLNIPQTAYFKIIEQKTAKLFELACSLSAMLAGVPSVYQAALKNYGRYLGIAFQLIDDKLDYAQSQDTTGKAMGNDFVEGKMTLPLIKLYELASPEEKLTIEQACKDKTPDAFNWVKKQILEHNLLEYMQNMALEYINKAHEALLVFPEKNEYWDGLITLTQNAVLRKR